MLNFNDNFSMSRTVEAKSGRNKNCWAYARRDDKPGAPYRVHMHADMVESVDLVIESEAEAIKTMLALISDWTVKMRAEF